ncbi:hypothetical protein RB594_005759 [Gaeumannomyces avenae]
MDRYAVTAGIPVSVYFVDGCCIEARRAEMTAIGLDGLREAIADKYHPVMRILTDEIRTTCRLLRELTDRIQVHIDRLPVVLNYLNVFLGCLARSLLDIAKFYDNKTISRETRWRKMYHDMSAEGGIPLPQRFLMYNHFLSLLVQLITRSPHFDINTLDAIQDRINKLREERGIPPPPVPVGPAVNPQALMQVARRERSDHWATEIFSRPLPSRTAISGKPKASMTHGPFANPGEVMRIPSNSKELFRRLFDNNNITVSVYINPFNKTPFMVVSHYQHGQSLFSTKGIHELCIKRSNGRLVLKRWSESAQTGKPWLELAFLTWEEMVLFHCTFVALKVNSALSVQLMPEEYAIKGERKEFRAAILDDGFSHYLTVFKDPDTEAVRLHAEVSEGDMKQCPIWTAFVTHQSRSPTWIQLKRGGVVLLMDVNLYVFCKEYREEKMRQNKHGAFEIHFKNPGAAVKFKECFYQTPPPSPSTQPTDLDDESEPPTPTSESPMSESPMSESPMSESPMSESPMSESPMSESPISEPMSEPPMSE